ncbi:class I mannose-6-phosphate isomerase, partial [Rhodopseudomonas sp. B29]|uniref:class I mannose-6-phosphate isomerase n=1 Tax=Rhodopseudomonas sp. B29 TaxID=95607 RepID=UPI0004CF589C
MAIERALVQVARKPWGVEDLTPWSGVDGSDDPIGELRFQRGSGSESASRLLLKLLFARQSLSIQVHPDDAFAHSIGLPNGKTEAWYILSAAPDARIAVGLTRRLTAKQLHQSIRDESIADLVSWRPVIAGDVVLVPAGTIHAIGGGIVLAEIQQRSDATFRLFDFGRQRDLDEDRAVAVSDAGPIRIQARPRRLNAARTALIAGRYFVLERIELAAGSKWTLNAEQETWLLVIDGAAMIGPVGATVGDVVFAEADRAEIETGASGMTGLVAYPGPDPALGLLKERGDRLTCTGGMP